jgi:hypothetical protein
VFGVSPNTVFRRDAGNLHAGTRALPEASALPTFRKSSMRTALRQAGLRVENF